jgi:DNA-binding response OmpR family regulator
MGIVLVVEDDSDLRETYAEALKSLGHQIHAVSTGSEALRWLPKITPDIVILDMQLPGASGGLILSYIRRYRRLVDTRVIIVSGYPDLAQGALDIWGADLYLRKPVSPSELRAAVTDSEHFPDSHEQDGNGIGSPLH